MKDKIGFKDLTKPMQTLLVIASFFLIVKFVAFVYMTITEIINYMMPI